MIDRVEIRAGVTADPSLGCPQLDPLRTPIGDLDAERTRDPQERGRLRARLDRRQLVAQTAGELQEAVVDDLHPLVDDAARLVLEVCHVSR